MIFGARGSLNGFRTTCPRPEADLDIFLRHALQSHTMIGWVNEDQDAHLANAAKKQTLYYKSEFFSPTGSHKVNTGLTQCWYAKQQGFKRVTTETGAGQWGTALSYAAAVTGLK